MADARHEQTLAHLRLLVGLPGYWELRALRRVGANRMTPRGSFWIVATATADGLLYERLAQALAWADGHDRQGTELFVGVNARSMEGKTKAAVPAVTACFADLDAIIERAIAGELSAPVPGHRYSLGWDPAKWRDRSALIVLDIGEVPGHVVACETLEGRDYSRQLARVVELSRAYNGAYVAMDSTGNEALLEQLVAADVPCEGVVFTSAAKQALIDGLVLALEQGSVTFPHVPALIQELRYYSYSLTAAGNVKLGAPDRAGYFDDLTTALALATKVMMAPPRRVEAGVLFARRNPAPPTPTQRRARQGERDPLDILRTLR